MKAASAGVLRLLASVLGLIASTTCTTAGTASRRPSVMRFGSTSSTASAGSAASAGAASA